MNVLFINPPRIRPDMPVLRDEICFQDVIYTPFPIRIAQTASVLRKTNPSCKIKVIDANALNISLDELGKNFPPADIVIFPSACGIIREDIKVAALAKKKNPRTKTVLIESIVAPWYPDRFLSDFREIDIIVQGQPEKVIPNIVSSFDYLESVRGISYRSQRGIINNGAADIMTDLDSMPFMAYDLFPMEKYSISIIDAPMHEKIIPGIRMRTTRDCPYGCPFCIIGSSKLRGYDRKWKAMSVKRVVDEIEYAVKEWGIWGFFFWDETFTLDKKRAYAISEEIIKRKLKMEWRCLTRIDCVDNDLLAIMYRSGCRQIEYGLESGDPELRKELHKNFPDEDAIAVVKQTRAAGIRANVDMIVGMPWESKQSLKKTLSLAKRLNADNVHLTMAFPYPGTDFYSIAEKESLLHVTDMYGLMINERVRIGAKACVRTRHLDSPELEKQWQSIRSKINTYYTVRKVLCEPSSYIQLFKSCRNPGEFFALLKKACRRFFKTLIPRTS